MKQKWSVKIIVTDEPTDKETPYIDAQITSIFDNMDLPAGISLRVLKPKKWKKPERVNQHHSLSPYKKG